MESRQAQSGHSVALPCLAWRKPPTPVTDETVSVVLSGPDISILQRALRAFRGVGKNGDWDDAMIDDVSSYLLSASDLINR